MTLARAAEGEVMTARMLRLAMARRGTKMRWVFDRVSGGARCRPSRVESSSSSGRACSWRAAARRSGARGGEALEQIGVVAEGKSNPETVAARPGEKGPAEEAFRIAGVAQVEVAYVADGLDLDEREGVEPSFEIEEGDASSFDESAGSKVTMPEVSLKAPEDYLFLRTGHWAGADCRMREREGAAKQDSGMIGLYHNMVR